MNMYLSAEMMLQEVVWNKLKSTLTMKVTRTRFLNLDMDSKMEFKTGNKKNKFKVPKSCGAVIYQRSEIWIQSFLDPTNCIEKVNLKLHWLWQIMTTLLQFHWQFQVHFWVLLPKLINSFANLLHRTWCKFRWWQKIVS